MGFNACTCSLDPLDPTSNTHGAPTKRAVNALNRRATVLFKSIYSSTFEYIRISDVLHILFLNNTANSLFKTILLFMNYPDQSPAKTEDEEGNLIRLHFQRNVDDTRREKFRNIYKRTRSVD